MSKFIQISGSIALALLLLAGFMSLLNIPNSAILILLALFIMLLFTLPVFLTKINENNYTGKAYNWIAFISLFIFLFGLFFALQRFLFPFRIAVALSVFSGIFLIYFFIREMLVKRFRLGRFSLHHIYLLFVLFLFLILPFELQAPDYHFQPEISHPAYPKGEGPVIYYDQAHNNLHTLDGRFYATARLLEADGYILKALTENFSKPGILEDCRILIVFNALHDNNLYNWTNPTFSAFTEFEIKHVKTWVASGGSLLLVVDHMPVSGAAYELAKEFGFELKNGHAKPKEPMDMYFRRSDYSLGDNLITNGRSIHERVDSFLAFDGSGFLIPQEAVSILTFDSLYHQWEPERVWDMDSVEPYPIEGYSLGAYREFDKGKIVVYGEAMMFTAQLGAGLSWVKIGMNSPKSPDNYQLLLNTIHWLDGLMDKEVQQKLSD